MRKVKKGFAAGLSLAMTAVVLAGCGSGSTGTTTAASTSDAASESEAQTAENTESSGSTESTAAASTEAATGEDGPFGKYPEPITISVVKDLGQQPQDFQEGDDLENNVWTRYDEENYNITFDWLWSTTSDQYPSKVNIAITSDDIPDIMKVNAQQFKMMVDNEQVYDLTDLYDKYTSDYTDEILKSDGGAGLQSATFDGKLLGIPKVTGSLMSANVLWVRTDWLDKLGLKLPETVDDFYKICDAFVNDDPDGDGKADTYALGLNKDLFDNGYAVSEGFFNMYGAYPNIWIEKDGKLAYGSIQPECKDALENLQKLYTEGYIDPEFGVKDASKVNEDACAGKFGMMFGTFWNMAWLNDTKVENPTMEWVPVAIPGGASAQIPFGVTEYYVVSKDCEHPEAVFKLLNIYLDKIYGEHAESAVYGITPDGLGPYDYPVVTLEPPMKNFDAAEHVTEAMETNDPSKLNEEEKNYYDLCVNCASGDYTNSAWHQYKMFGPNGSLTVDKTYWDNNKIVEDAYHGAPTDTISEKKPTLSKQELTDFTAIIMGESTDRFDSFVENWKTLGGDQITEEVNKWYSENK